MDREVYSALETKDYKHWWFLGRQAVFFDLMSRLIKSLNLPNPTILDIGCGSGFNLDWLKKFGPVFGIESAEEALEILKKRGFINVIKGELPNLQLNQKFQVITLFDVLEHVADDHLALANVFDHLEAGGLLVGSVPAYKWLWSDYDRLVHHERRYSKQGLAYKLAARKFKIEKISYFNTLLAPPALMIKIFKKLPILKNFLPASELSLSLGPLNSLLALIFKSERYLLRISNLPFGLSLVFIARKPTT